MPVPFHFPLPLLLAWQVLRVRYPYPAAGRVAAPPFAVVGFVAGALASRWIAGSPPFLINGVLWAIGVAIAAYLVYSSEGAPRPASVLQASSADGVVAGVVASTALALLDIVLASGAGGSGSSAAPSGLGIAVTLVVAGVAGGVAGGLIGLPIAKLGGTRLIRPRSGGRKSKSKRAGRNRKRR